MKVHTEWEPLANGTFTSNRLIHTGQLFVDDNLNDVIDKVSLNRALSLTYPDDE